MADLNKSDYNHFNVSLDIDKLLKSKCSSLCDRTRHVWVWWKHGVSPPRGWSGQSWSCLRPRWMSGLGCSSAHPRCPPAGHTLQTQPPSGDGPVLWRLSARDKNHFFFLPESKCDFTDPSEVRGHGHLKYRIFPLSWCDHTTVYNKRRHITSCTNCMKWYKLPVS